MNLLWNSQQKPFLMCNFESSSVSCKKWYLSPDLRTYIPIKNLKKTWNHWKTDMYFSFNFAWYSTQLHLSFCSSNILSNSFSRRLSLSGQINENLLFLVKLYRIKKPNILGAVKWNFDICRYVVIRRTDTFFFFMQTLCNCSFPANYFLIVRCSWYHTNLYFGYANNQQFY